MSAFNYLLDSCFSDLIDSYYDSMTTDLRTKYDYKYKIRHQFGIDRAEDDLALENEWKFEYTKLHKQRGYLRYLLRSRQYLELDIFFDTDFTFNDLERVLRSDYELQRDRELERYKYINRKHSYIPFSRSNLPVYEPTTIEIDSEPEIDLDFKNSRCTFRRKHRSYESLIDNNRNREKKDILDTRDYNKLYSIAIKLRSAIAALEQLRSRSVFKFLKLFRDVESKDIALNLLNVAKCCEYCKTIVCDLCDKGQFCCMCCTFCKKKGVSFNHPECEYCVQYQGQVEQSVGGDTDVAQTSTAHNVTLTETEITQSVLSTIPNHQWAPLVSSDTISSMDTLVNRWYRVGTYTWTTSQSRGITITSLSLPRDAIITTNTNSCDQPNTIPFRIHRYWRGDMVVKIHINCNKFQIGQLQCSWYYQPKADRSFTSKANVYTRSGTHHVVISAAPSNEVELRIPFKCFKSMHHTKSHANDGLDLPLDLGSLFVNVLSPLRAGGQTSPSAQFSVFIRFENNSFTGTIAGNIDIPPVKDVEYQMESNLLSMAVPLVEKLLTPSANDNNRDNPPVNRNPSFLVPTASHSWALGTDVAEPLHNLRLSGRAQTKHPDRDIDEMQVDFLKSKFMLTNMFTWSMQNNSGALLWSCPVNPLLPKTHLTTIAKAETNLLPSYSISPIGFLSSMYMYWRGSIEFRFDIVASQFHNGTLLCAYVPGVAEDAVITLEQARASPHVTFRLDNTMSYTWTVPYIADKPWWPRRYSGESVSNNAMSPSKLFVFVLNELVFVDSVAQSIDVLVYMRGGPDMEFATPVQPSIGLGYNRSYISSRNNTDVHPVSTTDTYYSGSWHSVNLVQVFRHATTSEAVARFSEPILDRPAYYKYGGANTPTGLTVANVLVPLSYCLFLRSPSFAEFIGVPIYGTSTTVLEQAARAAFANNYTPGTWMQQFIGNANTTTGFLSKDLSTTRNTYGGGVAIPWTAVAFNEDGSEFDVVFQGNRDEPQKMLNENTRFLQTTQNGMLTYGESFSDLKDLSRRYQIYGWISVPKTQIERDPGSCSFVVPILPQGLALALSTSNSTNQIWNRAREGHIPLIASLYRFYRGSIRIRIIVNNAEGLCAWYQHRPDRKLLRQSLTLCDAVTTAEAVFNHTYGVQMQDLGVNKIIELELPFYQNANFGLLQQPYDSENGNVDEWLSYYSLGELSVGFFGEQPANDIRCTVFYSLADDCRFSTYQGVPPMVLLDDLPEYNFEVEFQGFFETLGKKKVEQAVDCVSDKITSDVKPMLEEFLETLRSQFCNAKASIAETLDSLEVKAKLASIGGQLMQALNNPTPSTIAISIVSILVTLGIITYASYQVVTKYVVVIWNFIQNKVHSKELREEVGVAEEAVVEFHSGDETDSAVQGFLSLLLGGMCTLFGIRSDSIRTKFSSDVLFKNIDKGMRMSNVGFIFFKNLLNVLGDMKKKIISFMYPGFDSAECLVSNRDIIEKWIDYSQHVIDPHNFQFLQYNQGLQNALWDCYAFGKILRVKALETNYPAIVQLVSNTFDKLHKVYTELVARGIDPNVRKMPYVIYNYGVPEIGKSHITTDICTALCESENITTETSLMCVLNATSKFWDNCDRQPCLIMDDAFNIHKGPMLEDQIAAIFNVVSPVVLIPPKAAVEDKGRAYNPEIFVLNSNECFYKTDICNEIALWRRRDIIIHSALDPDFVKPGCIHCGDGPGPKPQLRLKVNSSLPPEAISSLKDNHHLKFKYTTDVTNCQLDGNFERWEPRDRWLKYDELIEILKKDFKKNRESEQIKFARRVEMSQKACLQSTTLVENIDNLEEQWNLAVNKRIQNETMLRDVTWKDIVREFSCKVEEAYKDLKYNVVKTCHNIFNPYVNKYAMINHACDQCLKFKHQCISCKIKMSQLMKPCSDVSASISVISPVSSSSAASVGDDIFSTFMNQSSGSAAACSDTKYESDENNFVPPVELELSTRAQIWLMNINKSCPDIAIKKFTRFLMDYGSEIARRLSRYPKSSRTISVFKNVCQNICSELTDCNADERRKTACFHNYTSNTVFVRENALYFHNPFNVRCPHNIDEVFSSNICGCCVLSLPWIYADTVKSLVNRFKIHEEWMSNVGHIQVAQSNTLDSIFGNVVKFVYDTYYNQMKPACKYVFSLFSTIDGIFSVVLILGSVFFGGASFMLGREYIREARHCEAIRKFEKKHMEEVDAIYANNPDLYQNFVQSVVSDPSFESKTYADVGKGRVMRNKKPHVPTVYRGDKTSFQAAQQYDVVVEKLRNNLISIVAIVDQETNIGNTSTCLMLRDRVCLIQRHYYDHWKSLPATAKFFVQFNKPLQHGACRVEINIFDCEVEWYSDPNLEYTTSTYGIITLPRTIPAFSNIVKFIATAADHEYIKSTEVYLYDAIAKQTRHCNFFIKEKVTVTADSWLRLDDCYAYQYSGKGLCGSILLCNMERPIIGMHFGGTPREGYSEPLVQESFNGLVPKPQQYTYEALENENFGDVSKAEFATLLYPSGVVPSELAHSQSGDSQFIPSLIQGVLPVDTEPNPLSKSDRRLPKGSNPLIQGCEHMGKPPLDFENVLLKEAAEDFKDVILSNVTPLRPKVDLISIDVAVCGLPNTPGYEPLEWSTSEGFPLRSIRPKGVKGKKWLFDLEESESGYKLKGMHGELKRQLFINHALRRLGKRCPTVFTDCLKDTCIDIEKCKIPGKTRIFSISPVQYTIAFKQYFGDFLASYQSARLRAEHGIGINVDSLEWTELATLLTTHGPKIVAGDYKNFGPSLMLKCVEECFNIILSWYTRYDPNEERQQIRRVLLSEILEAEHLCLNTLYRVPAGIPSGSPITTPLNSMVNSIYLRCAWKYITQQSFFIMRDNVKIVTYGDDVCMNVSDEFIDSFNTETLSAFFSRYNIIFTDIDKTDNIIKFRTLDNVTFLKRSFKIHPVLKHVFLSPIDEQSIRKCVSWISRKGDPKSNTLENCVQACELAFGHGPEYYNNLKELLSRECLKKLSVCFIAPTWFEKSNRCFY